MAPSTIEVNVRRPAVGVRILDIQGEITGSAEGALSAACAAAGGDAGTIILNLSGTQAIDSHGAGLLIALQARARRQRQQVRAFGLDESLWRAFRVTHLDEVIEVHEDEAGALSGGGDRAPGLKGVSAAAQPAAARRSVRAGTWAEPVKRLKLPPLPKGAININAEGRRPTGPVEGFGSLWRRTYTIRLTGARATAADVVRTWRQRFGSFWPPAGRFYGAAKPVEAGDMALLNLAGPAGLTIATGIHVIYAGAESFSFLSAEGHMFGGMITFSAHEEGGVAVAQVEALLRASDPLFEIAARLGLISKPEDEFWRGALQNLAAHFGVTGGHVTQQTVLLDPGLQWPQAKRIWYNGAARSALHLPVRWLRRLRGR